MAARRQQKLKVEIGPTQEDPARPQTILDIDFKRDFHCFIVRAINNLLRSKDPESVVPYDYFILFEIVQHYAIPLESALPMFEPELQAWKFRYGVPAAENLLANVYKLSKETYLESIFSLSKGLSDQNGEIITLCFFGTTLQKIAQRVVMGQAECQQVIEKVLRDIMIFLNLEYVKDMGNINDDLKSGNYKVIGRTGLVENLNPLSQSPQDFSKEGSEQFVTLLSAIPENAPFEEQVRLLSGVDHVFREQIAARLTPLLNERIKDEPRETLDEKKELARWVNSQVEPLGLAIREPKTGLPGKLRGINGHWPGVGRFAIEVKIDDKQKTPTVSDTLPELTLTDAIPRHITEVDWQQLVGPKENRTGYRR